MNKTGRVGLQARVPFVYLIPRGFSTWDVLKPRKPFWVGLDAALKCRSTQSTPGGKP